MIIKIDISYCLLKYQKKNKQSATMLFLLTIMSLLTPVSGVVLESFTVMTTNAALAFAEYHTATICGLLLGILIGKEITLSISAMTDAFVPNDEEIEQLLLPKMMELLNGLGDVKPSKKGRKKQTPRTFEEIYTAVKEKLDVVLGNTKPYKMSPTEVKCINNFISFITSEIEPLVKRTDENVLMDELNKFIATLKESQQVSPTRDLLENPKSANNPCYFGVYMPEHIKDEHGSHHITTAYSPAQKDKVFDYLGDWVTIVPAKSIVEWTHEETQQKYAYRPYMVIFRDNTKLISHNSIHLPEGGTQYGLNGGHQRTTQIDYEWDDDKSCESLHIPFSIKNDTKCLIQVDVDRTILSNKATLNDAGNFDVAFLTDPSRITNAYVSSFGAKLNQLGIPMRIVSSRRSQQNRKELERAFRSVFPSCIEFSWGNRIRCPDYLRDKYKAQDKHSRLIPNMWCYDDEDIVIHTHGYGSVIRNESEVHHYHGEPLPAIHYSFAINGPVGVGKTTLITRFIESVGGVVPFINDDGESPLVMVAAADASDPDHTMLCHEQFAMSFPDRETYFIFDTTGAGRKGVPIPVFALSPKLTPTVMAGCLLHLLRRTNHPNLNGIDSIDLSAEPSPYQQWDTNGMNLTKFINYVWFTRGQSQFAFEQTFGRIGQSCKFTTYGDVQFVLTSYREGLQMWCSVWGRQNRKAVHAFIDGEWRLIKAGLEVGAEMKPNTHSDDGDIYRKKLSNYQNQVCTNLFMGKPLPEGTVITSKKDGALIQTTLINEYVEELYSAVMASSNDLAKVTAKVSYDMYGGEKFILLSTNGTIMAAEHMWDYILTAVACDFGISQSELEKMMEPTQKMTVHEVYEKTTGKQSHHMSHKGIMRHYRTQMGYHITEEELIEMHTEYINPDFKPYQDAGGVMSAWTKVVSLFVERDMRLWNELNIIVNATHQMEAICPSRKTCTGKVHTELAMSYPTGGFTSLGIRVGDEYIPHFTIETLLNNVNYEQPLFWVQNDSNVILEMLTSIQRLSTDSHWTKEDFLEIYPPHNKYLPTQVHIDHEGFVLLVKTSGVKQWDYGKIKTLLYYLFHKPRESTMDTLIDLSMNCVLPHFPLAAAIHENQQVSQSIDFGALNKQLTTLTLRDEYGPPPPIENNRESMGIHRNYMKRREAVLNSPTTNDITMFRRFMYANAPKIAFDAYVVVTDTYNASHLVSYLSLIGMQSKTLDDNQKRCQKIIENSLATVSNVIQSGFSAENIDQLNNHMLYLSLNLH